LKKTLKVFAFAAAYLVAYLFVLFVLLYGADFLVSNFHLQYADLVAFVFGNLLMIGLLIYFRHRTRDRWFRAEAERWLANRSRRGTSRGHLWRKRLRRGIVWIPSAVVLVIFLFFPETAGLVSHLFCGRSVHLNQYRLETPMSWIVASGGSTSSAWVIAGKGIGRVGLRPYCRMEPPISEMVFYVTSSPPNEEILAHAKVLSTQTMQLGGETLICWDIIENADRRLTPVDPRFAVILCSTPQNDFHTDFVGPRSESSAFYDALRSITLTQ
jgi:hypothetical protein